MFAEFILKQCLVYVRAKKERNRKKIRNKLIIAKMGQLVRELDRLHLEGVTEGGMQKGSICFFIQ